MKTLHLFLAAAVCLSVSCKKEKKEDSYHVSCKIDGTAKAFSAGATATEAEGTLIIAGASSATASAELLALAINNVQNNYPIAARAYTDQEAVDFDIDGRIVNGDLTHIGGTDVYLAADNVGQTITNHFKITITAKDANSVRGTFSGDLFAEGDPSGAKKTVTEGDFFVKIQATPQQ